MIDALARAARATGGPARALRVDVADVAVWILPCLAVLVAVALFAPRFELSDPSLIDDWWAITYAPVAVEDILQGRYDADAVDYGGRYRPSYAVLSYVQWSLLGSAESTVGPTVFGLVRLLLFMGVVGGMTVFFVREVASRRWTIALAALVPTFVVATPGFSFNFIRFGIAEPMSFTAVVASLFAMVAAARGLLLRRGRRWCLAWGAMLASGYITYLFGVYMWEASVSVLAVLPVLAYWLATDRAGRGDSRRWPRKSLAAGFALLVLPLVHLLYHGVTSIAGGSSHGQGDEGLISELLSPLGGTLMGVLWAPGTPVWAALGLLTFTAALGRGWSGDRLALLVLSMLVAGLLAAYISGFAAVGLGRYYLPLIAAIGAAGARMLFDLRVGTRVAILAIVTTAVALGRPDELVDAWIEADHNGSAAIALASGAYGSGCPVLLVDFPGERRTALARMLKKPGTSRVEPECQAGSDAGAVFAVVWPARLTPSLPQGCWESWRQVEQLRAVRLVFCRRFMVRADIPSQDVGVEVEAPVVRLVRPERFVPASALHSET